MKLIHGGLAKYTTVNGVQIAVAPRESPPFPVEVMVFEEDTNLILTVDSVIEHEDEHIIRTMTDIMTAKKHKPGSVVMNGNSWYAVVIDLDSELVSREEWCENAFSKIVQLAEHNEVFSLALPILGTVHGDLQVGQQLQGLLEKITTMPLNALKYLWIVISRQDVERIKGMVNELSLSG